MSDRAWQQIDVIQIGNRRDVQAWQTDPRPVLLSRHKVGLLMVAPVGLSPFLSPERFDDPGVQFIHGAKGSGKTSLLLAKRLLLEDAATERRQLLCVPSHFPYVFSPFMDETTIQFDSWESLAFAATETWKYAWLVLLGAYLLNAIDRSVERDRPSDRSELLLSAELVKALTNQRDIDECKLDEKNWVRAFKHLVETSRKSPRETLKKIYDNEILPHLNNTVSKRTSPVLVFVDGIDETFVGPGGSPLHKLAINQKMNGLRGENPNEAMSAGEGNESDPNELARQVWVNAQTSLLAVATELSLQSDGVVKLIGSMRSEAYNEGSKKGTHAANQRANFVKEIKYTRDHLEAIFRANIRADLRANGLQKAMREDEIQTYFGTSTLRHPQVAVDEPVFAYLCRHTFDAPRDLMFIGQKLADRISEQINVERVHSVVSQSTEEIFADYIRFMDERWNPVFSEMVFHHIPKNIINLQEAQAIADKVKAENKIDEMHPLCYLYRRGLLGVISESGTQVFQNVAHVDDKSGKHLPRSIVYLLHPVLDQSLSNARIASSKDRYRITKGVPVGDGLPWRVGMGMKRVYLVMSGARVQLEIDGVSLSNSEGLGFRRASEVHTALFVACLLEMFDQETDRPTIDNIMLSISSFIESKVLPPKLRRGGSVVSTYDYMKEILEGDRHPTIFETINKRLSEHNLLGMVMNRSLRTFTVGIDGIHWNDLEIIQNTREVNRLGN